MRRNAWISDDPSMAEVVHLARRSSFCRANVLIVGESGVGKTFIARRIHETSLVSRWGFHTILCPSLVGDEQGQMDFMEALREISQLGGTVLFKNVDSLNIVSQKRLLELLDGRAIDISSNPDLRFIFTAHSCRGNLAKDGAILPELMLRISVITIEVPPLRNRPADIISLSLLFLKEFAQREGRFLNGFTPKAHSFLKSQTWDGNIWQLKAVIRNAVALWEGGEEINLELLVQAFKLTDSLKTSSRGLTHVNGA
ncbi:MAG: sigma 54-interacting transcriptional regulator [bacterium]